VSDTKSEEPTPKRLRRAREEGDSGASPYASQAIGLVVAVLLVPTSVAAVAERIGARLHEAIAVAAVEEPSARFDAGRAALDVITLSFPVLIAVAIAAGAAQLVQTGGFVATKRLGLKPERLNPFEGIRGLVTRARFFAVGRALFGAGLVAWLVMHSLRAHAVDLARVSGRLAYVGTVAAALAKTVAWDASMAGLALAAIDVLIVRLEWRRKLRMSKDEVKREYKESEGDPLVKQARERAHHEMLAALAIANVKKASVVVANPTHLACALRYDQNEGDAAPVVVASGEGDLAAQIIRAARDYNVPVVRDVPLAHALVELEIGDAIPESLYETVAEILRDAWEQK
jgi:flagellar biosynthetic protein FlhB